MNDLIKNVDIKLVAILFLIVGIFLISESNAHARFMKKIMIEPLLNPKDWKGSFEPGTAFTSMLRNSLEKSKQFQIIQTPSTKTKNKEKKLLKNSETSKEENPKISKEEKIDRVDLSRQTYSSKSTSSQYQVRGRIIYFNPDANPSKKGGLENKVFRHRENAEVKAVIELINMHTGRSLAKKLFVFVSNDGRTPFGSELTTLNFNTPEFKSSSIGKAFWNLNNSVKKFVVQILNNVPLEGNLILVDHKNKSALINLGKANGIMLRDVFTVLSMKTSFIDPLNETDLGDEYIRKGVIKIIEVQGRFSRAQIMAGADLAPGDLVVPKYRKPIKTIPKDQLPGKNITWGAYKGLPSLSY